MMYEQLYKYLNNYLNDPLCGFHKAHSTQYALFRLIQSIQFGIQIFCEQYLWTFQIHVTACLMTF